MYHFVRSVFTAPATTEIYTLSLHDALPIYDLAGMAQRRAPSQPRGFAQRAFGRRARGRCENEGDEGIARMCAAMGEGPVGDVADGILREDPDAIAVEPRQPHGYSSFFTSLPPRKMLDQSRLHLSHSSSAIAGSMSS